MSWSGEWICWPAAKIAGGRAAACSGVARSCWGVTTRDSCWVMRVSQSNLTALEASAIVSLERASKQVREKEKEVLLVMVVKVEFWGRCCFIISAHHDFVVLPLWLERSIQSVDTLPRNKGQHNHTMIAPAFLLDNETMALWQRGEVFFELKCS